MHTDALAGKTKTKNKTTHHTHTQTALKHTHNTAHRTATQKPRMETHIVTANIPLFFTRTRRRRTPSPPQKKEKI